MAKGIRHFHDLPHEKFVLPKTTNDLLLAILENQVATLDVLTTIMTRTPNAPPPQVAAGRPAPLSFRQRLKIFLGL